MFDTADLHSAEWNLIVRRQRGFGHFFNNLVLVGYETPGGGKVLRKACPVPRDAVVNDDVHLL